MAVCGLRILCTNLVADDTNDADDIFVYDRQTEDTTRSAWAGMAPRVIVIP